MFYKIILQESNILTITVSASSYEVGMVTLLFHPSISTQIIEEIKEKLNKLSNALLIRIGPHLSCNDAANLRPIIDFLMSTSLIAENDKPEVGALGQEIDKILQQRSALGFGIDAAQKDILETVADLYIEDIIENRDNYYTAIKLLRSAFYPNCLNEIDLIKIFIKENKIDISIIDSIIALWKIYHGEANLETTMLRMNIKQLPTLLAQRNILFKKCIIKLKEKYTSLDDENQLYMILGLLIYKAEGQRLSPLADSNKIILKGLTELFESTSTKEVFTGESRPGLLALVTEAFQHMEILRKDAEPDIERVKQLQHKFNNSPLLRSYLQELDKNKCSRNADTENLLFQALNENNKHKLQEALKTADINQYFSDGRTPLLIALQQCNEEIIKKIMDYNPDVNKKNRSGYYAPITSALYTRNLTILELLLKHGANVFLNCCLTQVQSSTFMKVPQFAQIIPLAYVVIEYQKGKEKIQADMLKLLLKYGAGTGSQINESLAQLLNTIPDLDSIVMIGGSCHYQKKFHAITTAEEFKKYVNKKDYSHWQKIFERILQLKVFNDIELYTELEFVIDYIKKILANENSLSNSNIFGADSPIVSKRSITHENLMKEINQIINRNPNYYQSFLTAINSRNYSKALRLACNNKSKDTYLLVEILLKYKDKLNFNIDERAGNENRAAIHLAALKDFQEAFNLLVSNGADVTLPDANGFSADKSPLMEEYKKSLSQTSLFAN